MIGIETQKCKKSAKEKRETRKKMYILHNELNKTQIGKHKHTEKNILKA